MAVRRPVKLVSGNLRDMTSVEVDSLVDECIRLYGLTPSVSLLYDNGNGTLNSISESRSVAGALATGSVPWPTPDATELTTVTYDNVVEQLTNTSFPYRTSQVYENFSYPIYRTTAGELRAMDAADMYDTFMSPAIQSLALSNTTPEGQAGTYFMSTSNSETDATLVSPFPIATDTNADIAAFASGSLPETIDQSTTATNFYLHRVDSVLEFNYDVPMSLKRDTSDLQVTPRSQFQTMMQDLIQYYAAQTIRYNFYISTDTSFGVARGTGITDTYTSGSTTRYEQPDPTTYYAQNVPSGTPTVQKTTFLRIGTI